MSASRVDINAQSLLAWDAGQEAPVPTGQESHVVQLYSDDGVLLDVLSRFIAGAIAVGDAGIVIATKAHHEGLSARLKALGLDSSQAIRQGRYILLDAEDMVSPLMQNGRLNETCFNEIVGEALTRARAATGCKESRIAVFGELVALLWAQGKAQEAIRVEQLWNGLAQKHYFSLLCAYPTTGFDNDPHIEPFLKMCAQHSGVVPNEIYLGFSAMEERLRTIAELQQKTRALENALQLRQSEERFRLLVEAVRDYAIFMLDPTGHIVSWNAGAHRLKGYLGAEIIGKHFSCFYPPEDLQNGKPEMELKAATKEGSFEDEGWRLRKDGSQFWASVIITAVRDHTGQLIGFAKVTRDFTEQMQTREALKQEIAERKEAQRRLCDSENSLRQLSRHLLRTQDEERRRVGRELHDSLGQSLAAMKIGLDSLSTIVGNDNRAVEKVAECVQLVSTSIKEVRTISYLLYPPMLEEMGLQSAILWYLDGFGTRSGIKATLDVRPDFERLSRDAELALFRVLQESLTNIHRHSGSATAHVRLSTRDGIALLEIKDQGTGIAPGLQGQSNQGFVNTLGVGLRGMKERMLQLGGSFEVVSTEEGTTITAAVPIAVGPSKTAN